MSVYCDGQPILPILNTHWATPIPGPDEPEPGSQTVRISTWPNTGGLFWQEGSRIGVIWDSIPEHGDASPPHRTAHWTLGSEEVARRYFERMRESYR